MTAATQTRTTITLTTHCRSIIETPSKAHNDPRKSVVIPDGCDATPTHPTTARCAGSVALAGRSLWATSSPNLHSYRPLQAYLALRPVRHFRYAARYTPRRSGTRVREHLAPGRRTPRAVVMLAASREQPMRAQ